MTISRRCNDHAEYDVTQSCSKHRWQCVSILSLILNTIYKYHQVHFNIYIYIYSYIKWLEDPVDWFNCGPQNGGKKELIWERESRQAEREREREGGGGNGKSRLGLQWTPGLKIERYQQRIDDRLWLVGRNSNGKPLGKWAQDTKVGKGSVGDERRPFNDGIWTLATATWRPPKIRAPIVVELREWASIPARICEDGPSDRARVKTKTENEKDHSRSAFARTLLSTFYFCQSS